MAFNSQRTFRAPTFRSQLSVRRVYETLQPRSEMKETPEAYLLHVYLPGFTKDQMKIELLDMSRKLRITGERPIPGNKWRKFDQTYPVPENSEAGKLEAKFEQGTLILKMQKKPISQSSQVAPQQEVEKVQETNIPPPQSTKMEESTKDMKSDSPQTSQSIEKKTQNDDDTSSQIPKETISNSNPPKGQQEFEPKPTSKDTSNNQIDEKSQKGQEEFETKPTSIETAKTQIDEKPQNGQEVLETKPTSIERTKTQIDEKPQNGQEDLESKPTSIERTKTQTNEKAQKGEEEVEPKTIEKLVTKENLEEKIVGMSAEDAEKERNSKKEEVEEKNEKPYESSKTMKDEKNQNLKENEIEKAEPSAPNVPEKEKESCCRIPPNQEGKNGIRKFAATSSQFVTRIVEGKWSGEERHLVENVGAAVLVIAAFGAYVSYWFSS